MTEMEKTRNTEQYPIPIVDLGPLKLPKNLEKFDATKDLPTDDPVVRMLAEEVVRAFTDIGFCYLVNHAVSQELVNSFNEKTGEFFPLPNDVKARYRTTIEGDVSGWVGAMEEKLDETTVHGDFKEFYNITPTKPMALTSVQHVDTLCSVETPPCGLFTVVVLHFPTRGQNTAQKWPDEETPGFRNVVMDLYNISARLCHVVLKLMGIGLQLEDPDYFIQWNSITERPNFSTIRAIYYPPVPREIARRSGVMRCGEHSDWGSITCLYQDDVGGLEVMNRAGEYIPATPIEGSVVVNIGDMMQRWTADRLVSTKHRVVLPKEDFGVQRTRRSIAFFVLPDDEALVRCIDNSDKYPPVTFYDYAMDKLVKTRVPSTK